MRLLLRLLPKGLWIVDELKGFSAKVQRGLTQRSESFDAEAEATKDGSKRERERKEGRGKK